MALTISGVKINGSLTAVHIASAAAAAAISGYLRSWGSNSNGQLGLGNQTDYSSPKQVGALSTWSTINASLGQQSFAIKTDGTLWAWGLNSYGRLGLGNTSNYSSPKQVGALTTWSTVEGGGGFGIGGAIKTDGTIWAWGYNGSGGLGLNNTTHYSSPKQVGALTTWLKLSASAYGIMAIKTDGTLWGWGSGANGRLGLGDTTNRSSPTQIGALTNWSKISAKAYGAVAVKTDGTLWTWGYGGQGALGLGDTIERSSPTQVGALSNWAEVHRMGQNTILAVKTDGTLWSWGNNLQGQLGLGNTTYYSSPTQIGALTNWSKVSGGNYNSSAIKTNGTVWTWGYNNVGQLGDGSTVNKSSPVQVGTLTTWAAISTGNHTLTIST